MAQNPGYWPRGRQKIYDREEKVDNRRAMLLKIFFYGDFL